MTPSGQTHPSQHQDHLSVGIRSAHVKTSRKVANILARSSAVAFARDNLLGGRGIEWAESTQNALGESATVLEKICQIPEFSASYF